MVHEPFPSRNSLTKVVNYILLWEDSTRATWQAEELSEFLSDSELNIKVKDEKHLLYLRMTKERIH